MATFVATTPSNPSIQLKKAAKRFQGTYKVVPKVEWTTLLVNQFGNPDWAALYPVTASGQPKGILPPRMACKLFHDGLFIIQKGEENPKYIQDRIPDVAHKQFRKKQWRKQFFESMRRVCCRLAIGLGFKPNCVAEDVFIHAVLNMSFDLGWRRIEAYTENLPVTDKDRDFGRVTKLGANEDVANLTKLTNADVKKKITVDANVMNTKAWFKCYDPSIANMFNHIICLHEDDTDNWSVSSGTASTSSSTLSPSRSKRADSMGSEISTDNHDHRLDILSPIIEEVEPCPMATKHTLSASNLAALAEQLSSNKI